MFDGVGWGEIAVLLLIGLFVFGPDRLPKAARDAGRLLRQLRQMATGVREDIRSELGPEFADLDLRTLHPKTFVRKHLLEDDDDPLFKSYLSGRGALDRALFDDLGDPPTLTKDRTSLTKDRTSLTKDRTPSTKSGASSLTKDLNGRSDLDGRSAGTPAKASLLKSPGHSSSQSSSALPAVPSRLDGSTGPATPRTSSATPPGAASPAPASPAATPYDLDAT